MLARVVDAVHLQLIILVFGVEAFDIDLDWSSYLYQA
jgi:hypothetical protein